MSRVDSLRLTDFRCYRSAEVAFTEGVNVITGPNGRGKTSLLEAVHWVATTKSFRGVPNRALVRSGAETAIVRAEVSADDRVQTVEAELRIQGRDRVLVNRQPLRRIRDLLGVMRVTVFAPDDLDLVKGGPGLRRNYLDDLLVATAPRYEAVRAEFDKVLKHRNALLKRGVRGEDDRVTLDVFDEQLARSGAALADGRLGLVDALFPLVRDAYGDLAPSAGKVGAAYRAAWLGSDGEIPDRSGLEEALRRSLEEHRRAELERRGTLVGPQRDDWELTLDDLDVRTHASQGEQRTMALALRLGGHRRVTQATGDDPALLLDDVFSELDLSRAHALVGHLPATQTLVTTAVDLPEGLRVDAEYRITDDGVERA